MIDLGPARRFLGMNIDTTELGYTLYRTSYTEGFLQRFKITDACGHSHWQSRISRDRRRQHRDIHGSKSKSPLLRQLLLNINNWGTRKHRTKKSHKQGISTYNSSTLEAYSKRDCKIHVHIDGEQGRHLHEGLLQGIAGITKTSVWALVVRIRRLRIIVGWPRSGNGGVIGFLSWRIFPYESGHVRNGRSATVSRVTKMYEAPHASRDDK